MADQKLTQRGSLSSSLDSSYIHVVQDGASLKQTKSNFLKEDRVRIEDLELTKFSNTARIDNIEDNQYSGVITYETLLELPTTGVVNTSYKVTNDNVLSSNNGYYHWNGSAYIKDADLVLNEIDKTNTSDGVSGRAVALHSDLMYPISKDANINATKISIEEMQNFLVDIQLYGTRDASRIYSLTIIKRNELGIWELSIYSQEFVASGTPSVFTKVCSFYVTDNPEGEGITVHDLIEDSSSGITGRIAVDWSKITDGNKYDSLWASGDFSFKLSDLIWNKNNGKYISILDNSPNPRLTIPNNIYTVVGTEFSLYYDAVILSKDSGLQSPLNYNVEVYCDIGKMTERCYRHTPILADVGTHTLTVSVYDKNKVVVETKTVNMNVINATAPASIKNVLLVGDSLTDWDNMPKAISDKFVSLGSNAPVFWGTQITNGVNHEGRGGWAYVTFAGASSPFYNAGGLDIANYRSVLSMGAEKFDVVSFQLGVNDSFGTLKTEEYIFAVVALAKSLIDAFLIDNASTEIIIEIPTIDGNTKGGWGTNYGAEGYKEYYQRNIFNLRELLLQEFDDNAYSSKVSVGCVGLGLDRYYGYDLSSESIGTRYSETNLVHTNGVHPKTSGYNQMADTRFPIILSKL